MMRLNQINSLLIRLHEPVVYPIGVQHEQHESPCCGVHIGEE